MLTRKNMLALLKHPTTAFEDEKMTKQLLQVYKFTSLHNSQDAPVFRT